MQRQRESYAGYRAKGTILWILIFCLCSAGVNAVDLKYPISEIPDDLKVNVDAVVRSDQMEYTIESQRKGVLRRKLAVTILNAKGRSHAKLILDYNPLRKIPLLTAVTYDEEGKAIRKLKPGEIQDYAAQDGFSLYSDDRLKVVDMAQSSYPYTVEFSYVIEYKYLYHIPGMTIAKEKMSVQHAMYRLVYPVEIAPRYRVMNWKADPVKENMGGTSESLTWTFDNVKAVSYEPQGPHEDELTPRIMAAPSTFEYEGYSGNMSTWKSYGDWVSTINAGRDELSPALKEKIHAMTTNLKSTEDKTRALYSYLQEKTRYVSIQEGIGGVQTFPASTVEQTGYGDCKALCNFMVAMLKEAGIKGYYTRIRAGDDEAAIVTDFPSHQTNHIIVAVPNGADTLWLECTSQTNPFGYLGHFTEDRVAIMLTEQGGKLVRTPSYNATVNTQVRTALLDIDIAGNAKAKVRTTYTGTQTENGGLLGIVDRPGDTQRKWIQDETSIPNFNITSYSITGTKNKIPSVEVKLNLDLIRYASVSGKRLFLTPNLMNRTTYIPDKIEERKTDVVREFAYTDIDSVIINLPEALYPEFIPEPMKVSNRFADYEATCTIENGKVIYVRKVVMRKGRFPKESYNELIDYFKSVSKFDNLKLVLLNKT